MTKDHGPLTSKGRRITSMQLVVVGFLAAMVAVLALPAIDVFLSSRMNPTGASGER